MASERRMALVTGGTDGIGKATALALARRGYDLAILGRSGEKGEAVLAAIRAVDPEAKPRFVRADLSLLRDTRRAIEELRSVTGRLDALILHAGGIVTEHALTDEGNEYSLAMGFLSNFLLVNELAPLLEQGARPQVLINGVALRPGYSIDFSNFRMVDGWSLGKSMMRMMRSKEVLAAEFGRRHPRICSNVFFPGLVKSGIARSMTGAMKYATAFAVGVFGIRPERSGEDVAFVVEKVERERASGKFFARRLMRDLSPNATDPEAARRLWEEGEVLTRVV